MKAQEIRELNDQELASKIQATRTQLFDLRMALATGDLEQTHQIKALKKDIARMKLVQAERKGENGKK